MILRKLYIVTTLFLLSIFSQAQEATAALSNEQIKIGEQTTIQLELRATADGQHVEFPSLIDTISGKIQIVKISDIDTAYDENDISIRILSQTITITSWDSGFHAIPPFLFKIGTDEVKTEAQLLEVTTVPIEAEADIKDIKEIMEVPFSFWDWVLVNKNVIGTIILFIVLTIVAFILFKKFKRETVQEEVVVPKEDADVIAIKQLDALNEAKLWQNGKTKAYYTQISHILREYLENRFKLSALERTSDVIELLLSVEKEIEDHQSMKLLEILRLSDMAKFAKQEPMAAENEEVLKQSYQFVDLTKLVILPEEEEVKDVEPIPTSND